MVRVWLLIAAVCWGGPAVANCRQALVLALDVSGSVDAREYRLQRYGVAEALTSDAVRAVLLRSPDAPVNFALFEWSGPTHHVFVQPWVPLTAATLDDVAERLRDTPRVNGDPTTAIGSAMAFGVQLLEQQSDCWKRTLDISGDGKANTGPRPQDIRDDSFPPDIAINGLVIGAGDTYSRDQRLDEIKELSAYYNTYVIRGPSAFVETALGFEDYANAMQRKLLRELQSIALSAVQ